MKFFVDLSKKQLIKSAASNVALERIVLKRRDSLAVEVVFVSRNAVAVMPGGTTVSVALKKSFSDSNFLASASGTPPILNLNTVPLEALFSTNPASLTALLEIRWTIPGETTRTATLQAEVQNSVILGTEATPEAIPDGKATQAQAEAGTDNAKWMTPLRTAQAIAVLAPPPTWDAVQNKPATFPPSSHGHAISEVTGLQTALDAKATTAALFTETTARQAADTALGQRIDSALANLDPAAIDSIAEAVSTINTERTERIAGDAALDGKITAETTARTTALSTKADLVSGKVPAIQLTTFTYGQPGIVPNSFGSDAGKFLKGDGNWTLPTTSDVIGLQTALDGKASTSHKFTHATGGSDALTPADIGAQPAGSYATLVSGKVPADQLPSYVDDVLEFANLASLPATGETGKIYVTTTAPSKAYRWTGSTYLEISSSEVTSVAGKTGAVTLGTADITGLQTALNGKANSSHKHDGDNVYLSNDGEYGPVILEDFAEAAANKVFWATDTNINGRPVYEQRGGSGSKYGLFYQNSAWHLFFGAPITSEIIASSDQEEHDFPWEFAWDGYVRRANVSDFHNNILNQLQFVGAPKPLSEVTGLQSALALKADLVSGLVPTTQLPPISFQTTRYDGDGTAFSFAPPGTLTNSDSPSAISVTINGVTQEPGSDYTLNIATNRVVLLSALPLGDKIVITRPILLPSNSTLTAEQLGALTNTSLIDGGSF